MIAVIADDFTGAAELGGIGLRHGLMTEVSRIVPAATDADLLVIAADTRSKGEAAAVEDMLRITQQLKRLKPDWIYKKTDSVLRGHVVAELRAHLDVLGFASALLIPANPAFGRTIVDGHYFLNGIPVHQSAFSIDPEFPVSSSDVRDMLRAPGVEVKKLTEPLPGAGIIVGEVRSVDDLRAWAARVAGVGTGGGPAVGAGSGPGVLLAGASGFFSALLDRGNGPVLYVSGTTFDSSRERIRELAGAGGPVIYMPAFPGEDWFEQAAGLLRRGRVVVAIGDVAHVTALQLRTSMATVIGRLLQEVAVGELIIEGGSTAYAILEKAGLHRFVPRQELAQGVVRMAVPEKPGLYVTVKPGSYSWPESIRY
jgi:uncharacterized protein YgbK (DUF1537 family)